MSTSESPLEHFLKSRGRQTFSLRESLKSAKIKHFNERREQEAPVESRCRARSRGQLCLEDGGRALNLFSYIQPHTGAALGGKSSRVERFWQQECGNRKHDAKAALKFSLVGSSSPRELRLEE